MHSSRAVLFALALASLLSHSAGPAAAQSTSLDPAALKAALIGKWVLDPEATADAMARYQFGPRQQVTLAPTKPGQPRTFRTNFINKPFNPQEYEQFKAAALEGFRAKSNAAPPLIIFAPDGSGTRSEQRNPGAPAADAPFQWVLDGRQLTIKNPTNESSLQIAFTNKNQLRIPSPALRGLPCIFKPERAAAK